MDQEGTEQTNNEESNREKLILERILSLKQLMVDGEGGPLELHELGICYFHLKNYEQAVGYLDELLKKYPDYLEVGAVHGLLIYSLVQENQYQRAEKAIAARLKITAHDTRLLSMRAHIHEKRGDNDKAIAEHRRILELEPDNINSLNSLGYLLTLHGEKADEAEAYTCLKKAVSSKPDHPAYLDSLGVFLARKGQKENARKALLKALQRAPQNGDILQHLKDLLGV